MVASSVAAVDAVRAAAVVSSSHALPKAVCRSRAINRLAATAKGNRQVKGSAVAVRVNRLTHSNLEARP